MQRYYCLVQGFIGKLSLRMPILHQCINSLHSETKHTYKEFSCQGNRFWGITQNMHTTVQRETLREKNFASFKVLWVLAEIFSVKYRGVHMASFGGTSERSAKVFPLYSIVCWNVLVFLNCPQLCKCLYSLGSHKTNKELILLLSGTYYNQINTISIGWFQTLTAYLCVFVAIGLCPPHFT